MPAGEYSGIREGGGVRARGSGLRAQGSEHRAQGTGQKRLAACGNEEKEKGRRGEEKEKG